MLSEPEQRLLHEIERTIAATDPRLATLLSAPRRHARRRALKIVHDVVCVMSLALGLLCLVLGEVGSGLAAVVFAALVLQTRRMRFPPTPRPRAPAEPNPSET
jgi:Protein of unknown function (DUF3040)